MYKGNVKKEVVATGSYALLEMHHIIKSILILTTSTIDYLDAQFMTHFSCWNDGFNFSIYITVDTEDITELLDNGFWTIFLSQAMQMLRCNTDINGHTNGLSSCSGPHNY